MEKKKIHISGKMPCTLAVSHIECFLDGLRNGSVVFEQGEEKIVLHPHAEIEMNIEAHIKNDKQHLVISLDWDTPEIETYEYEEETPHEHPHWHDEEHPHRHGAEHHDEMYGRPHGGYHAVHYPPAPHEHMHGFHTHYHCHGKGEYQLCHAHEHTESHHEHYGQGSHVHGYRGCCEGTPHIPHAGCCAEHNYGVDIDKERGAKKKKFLAGQSGNPTHSYGITHGDEYRIWHAQREPFYDHKHPQHFTSHKMFHGTQTHHGAHGKGENYHRKSHTAVPPRTRQQPDKEK